MVQWYSLLVAIHSLATLPKYWNPYYFCFVLEKRSPHKPFFGALILDPFPGSKKGLSGDIFQTKLKGWLRPDTCHSRLCPSQNLWLHSNLYDLFDACIARYIPHWHLKPLACVVKWCFCAGQSRTCRSFRRLQALFVKDEDCKIPEISPFTLYTWPFLVSQSVLLVLKPYILFFGLISFCTTFITHLSLVAWNVTSSLLLANSV